jgi:hypothetical protein
MVVASRQAAPLVGTGLASLLVYLAATLRLPLWQYGGRPRSWSQVLCPYNACPGGPLGALAACLAGLGILVAAYLWGWRLLRSGGTFRPEQVRQARRITWGFAVLFAATLCWLMPITSDLFNYHGRAHQFAKQGTNPLLAAAPDTHGDGVVDGRLVPIYATAYSSSPSIYGPAWVLISLPSAVGFRGAVGSLLYLKGLAFVAFLGGAWLLERTVQDTAEASCRLRGSQKAVEALYLFVWNPLLLFMAVGNGHNDIVMMALVLMGCWLLVRESWALALAALAVSVWIKYVSVILVPLFGLYALRRISLEKGRVWPRALGGGLCLVSISALVFLPFGAPKWAVEWAVGLPTRLLRPSNWVGNGIGLWGTLSELSGGIMVAGLILFTMVYVTLVGRFALREGTLRELMGASFLALLAAFLLGAARSQPWHLIWATAVAGLAPSRWAWPVVLALSAMMLLSQLWVEWGAPGLGISTLAKF